MKVFTKEISCSADEELLQREGWDTIALQSFCIWNLGEEKIQIVLNNSDFELALEPDEGFEVDRFIEVHSCKCLSEATVKFSGWY